MRFPRIKIKVMTVTRAMANAEGSLLQPTINTTVRLQSRLEAKALPVSVNIDRDVARQGTAVVARKERATLPGGRGRGRD